MTLLTESKNIHSQQALPFIIGISGHRDVTGLASDPENGVSGVKKAIKDCLIYWRKQVGASTPVWLLSGMAEGADLIAVEAADELIDEGWDADFLKVVPCLPMEVAAYEKDFSSSPSQDQFGLAGFRQLLDKYKDNQLIIKNTLSSMRYQAAMVDMNYGNDRNSLYLNQGAFLARYANVVFCLWDGHESEGTGGTGDVAKLKLGQEVNWPEGTENHALQQPKDFDGQIGGMVHHIPVNRSKISELPLLTDSFQSFTVSDDELPFELYVTHNFNGEKWSSLQNSLSDEFSNLIEQLRFYNQETIVRARDSDVLHQSQPGLGEARLIFHSADSHAIHYQALYRRRMIGFFLTSLFGLAAYELVGNFLGLSLGIVFNAIILVAVLVCWRFIRHSAKRQWKWKYQLSRGVAESIRIRGFLNLANISPDNKSLIPRRQRQNLPLFSHAIAVAEFDWWKSDNTASYQTVKQEWLVSQHNFLLSRLQTHRPFPSISDIIFKRPLIANNILALWAKRLFITAVCLGWVLLVMQFSQNTWLHTLPMGQIDFVLMLSVQYSLMAGAAMALWSELAGYKTTAVGYENLSQLYARAITIMDKNDPLSINHMLRELASEAILEHCEWNHYESQCDLKARQ